MKIVGLITEYNPFHKGHLYHIEKAKEVTGADVVLVVMGGDFVQRGEPAIFPKEVRTQAALAQGASAVFELPVIYATGSGEIFATGAVGLLHAFACVDAICFGAESNNLSLLSLVAGVLAREPKDFKEALKERLKEGLPFPKAREEALIRILGQREALEEVLHNPNNILAIEYLKALIKLDSPMKPYLILREGAAYHEKALGWKFDSAASIRRVLRREGASCPGKYLGQVEESVPEEVFGIYRDYLREYGPASWRDYSLLLKYRLMEECQENNDFREGLTQYLDVSRNLANRMDKYLEGFVNPESFIQILKTKDLNYSRISRCLLHILLGIKTSDLQDFMENGPAFYGRILGFRKKDAKLLAIIKKNSRIPMLSKLADAKKLLADFYGDEESLKKLGLAMKMLDQDFFASELYDSVQGLKSGKTATRELRKQIQTYDP